MRFIRLLGNIALWLGALLGVAAGTLFLADALGWARPLIVISGSMEPGIHTGDLLIATRANSADLEVGDVVSLPSDITDKLVTHRIIHIESVTGGWEITMKGDANAEDDINPYFVGDTVWKPAVQIPHVGFVVSKLMQPSVAVPIVIALGALLGMSLLDGGKRPDDELDDERDHDHELDPTDELERDDLLGTDIDLATRPLPFPSVAVDRLLEPSLVERSLIEPSLADIDVLAELDRALAALGIHVEMPSQPEQRSSVDRILTG